MTRPRRGGPARGWPRRFENWGMDLILGAYPLDAWDATLNVCVALAPAHVSAYGLTYEKGTPFGGRAG